MFRRTPIIYLILLLTVLISCSTSEERGPVVVEGPFQQTITETGELAAVNAKTFVMPRFGRYWYEMKIIGLLDHGTAVKAGDSLIQFDPSEIKKFIIDRETNLETQRANLEKTTVEIDNRRSDIRSTLRSEQAAFDLKQLGMEQYRFESDKVKKVKELEFEQAKIRLEKATKSAYYSEIIAKNQLQIQQIRVKRIESQIADAYEILPTLTVHTPISGIFQIATKRRSREMLQLGDEVRMGNRLGDVPDLTWMKVNTVVDEADFLKVFKGQEVEVRLDALPDLTFQGEVTQVSRLCRPIDWGARQKVFDVEVTLKVSDERLKPGMTVSCEFICARLDQAFSVPLNCVETVDGKSYVYLNKPGSNLKLQVKTGPSNNTHVVVEGNIEKGQRLVPISQTAEKQEN